MRPKGEPLFREPTMRGSGCSRTALILEHWVCDDQLDRANDLHRPSVFSGAVENEGVAKKM